MPFIGNSPRYERNAEATNFGNGWPPTTKPHFLVDRVSLRIPIDEGAVTSEIVSSTAMGEPLAYQDMENDDNTLDEANPAHAKEMTADYKQDAALTRAE